MATKRAPAVATGATALTVSAATVALGPTKHRWDDANRKYPSTASGTENSQYSTGTPTIDA